MRFRVLGPLQVDGGSVTATRDRVVLAMLLLNAGRIVPASDLVDALWDAAPPATARGQVQSCVSRLRRAGLDIASDPAGYALTAPDLDLRDFQRLTERARATPPDEARAHLRAALDLWRGPALAGVESRAVRTRAAVLDEQRAVAVEDWVELELAAGRERELLAELGGLVELYPLRERLRGQLMLALYRSGRQADALAEYRRARAALREDLGIEPGPALRDLHQKILTGDVAVPAAAIAVVRPVRCLPRSVADFTGRADAVDRMVTAASTGAGPVIAVVDGMAGSGKTTLALHVAGMVADRYPDAHLFVDLHGHSDRSPVDPSAALVTLLLQLGVHAERIPVDLDGRVAMWRSELAARRALVVLDNAASTAQVTPLLPAAPGTFAVVTSRRRLTGLDGVRPESLSVLPPPEAVQLLARIAGDRVLAEPSAADEVARRCGFLPLAIRLAGARLAHRPRWRVADLVRRLGAAALPELAAEDRTVSAAFALSYGQLGAAAQRMFRLLGMHPAERFDALSVAALCDLPLDEAGDLLDDLVDAHLVEEPEAGIFRLHDLMREYAATLAQMDAADDRATALDHLLNHYIWAAWAHARTLEVGTSFKSLTDGAAHRPDLVAAITNGDTWFERSRRAFVPLIDAACAAGNTRSAFLLARVIWRWLYGRAHFDDIIATQTRGLEAARRAGNLAATAACLNYLASASFFIGRVADSAIALRESVDLCIGMGDFDGVANVRSNLAAVLELLGLLDEAEEVAVLAAEDRFDDRDSNGWQAIAVIGNVYAHRGDYETALRCHRLCCALAARHGHTLSGIVAVGHLGQVRLRMAQPRLAALLLHNARRRKSAEGHVAGEIESTNDLAVAYRGLSDYPAAIRYHGAALQAINRAGQLQLESTVLNDFARTLFVAGDKTSAVDVHVRALHIAQHQHMRYEQGRAHAGIAECVAAGEPQRAREHWKEALKIFEQMRAVERHEVAGRLAAL
jgi:DNA-binding SARP family transcriptional activator